MAGRGALEKRIKSIFASSYSLDSYRASIRAHKSLIINSYRWEKISAEVAEKPDVVRLEAVRVCVNERANGTSESALIVAAAVSRAYFVSSLAAAEEEG